MGWRDETPARPHRVAIPKPLSYVIAVVPQIELLDLVALLVFEDPPHRQGSAGGRADQIDIVEGPGGCLQPPALCRVEDVEAPDLQPATVIVADVEAIRLRQFVQRGFEDNDCAVDLAPVIRVGERGICRQHANEGAQLRYLGLEAAEGIRAGGIHRGRRRFSCRSMISRDLDKYQTRRESRDEGHHCGRYRDAERQHPLSSARPPTRRSKKGSRCKRGRDLWWPAVCRWDR